MTFARRHCWHRTGRGITLITVSLREVVCCYCEEVGWWNETLDALDGWGPFSPACTLRSRITVGGVDRRHEQQGRHAALASA